MGANLKYIFQSFRLNIAKEAQYKTSFALKVLMMIANDAFFIIQWVIIFGIVDSIGGYGFNEVMLLWAVSAGGYGIAHTFFNGAFNFGKTAYDGKLDVFLTQPKNLLINVSCSSTDVSAIGDIIYGFVVLIFIKAPIAWFAVFPVVIILSGLVYAAINVIYSSLCFYVKRGDEIGKQVSECILKFGNYPISIFSQVVKLILFTVVPAAFFTFIPAEFMLSFNFIYFAYFAAFCVLVVALAFLCFNKGVKKYSSGSLGGGRL